MSRLARADRRLFVFPALTVAAALLWSMLGIEAPATGQDKPVRISRAHEGRYVPDPGRPVIVLAVGSDQGSAQRPEPPETGRADSIHLLSIDPKTRRGTVLGFPRDLWVEIPGRGTDRINSALFGGGVDLVVATMERLTGCEIDYTMVAGFDGFRRLVDGIGGVPVDVPVRMQDRLANRLDLEAGRQTLDGLQALGFARSRKTAATPRGDIDRSFHQGKIIVGALEKAREETASRPGRILDYLMLMLRHTTVDISPAEALRLGILGMSVAPHDVVNLVVDADITMRGSASVVVLNSSGNEMIRDLCDDGVILP